MCLAYRKINLPALGVGAAAIDGLYQKDRGDVFVSSLFLIKD